MFVSSHASDSSCAVHCILSVFCSMLHGGLHPDSLTLPCPVAFASQERQTSEGKRFLPAPLHQVRSRIWQWLHFSDCEHGTCLGAVFHRQVLVTLLPPTPLLGLAQLMILLLLIWMLLYPCGFLHTAHLSMNSDTMSLSSPQLLLWMPHLSPVSTVHDIYIFHSSSITQFCNIFPRLLILR